MMPEVDGLNLCKRIRTTAELAEIPFIMVSTKAYEFDQNRAFEFGADGYIRKPLNTQTFTDRIYRILDDHIDMTFWGVRGTLPVSGEQTLKYGGNTSNNQFRMYFSQQPGIRKLRFRALRTGLVWLLRELFRCP